MIMGNTLYFCVNDRTRPRYEQAGMSPFAYNTRKGRVQVRRYYAVPEDLFEAPDALIERAREAIAVAHGDGPA